MSNPKDINRMHPDKNPDAVDFKPTAHSLHSQEKIDIDQSGLGREQGQIPSEEHYSDKAFSQVDKDGKTEINDDDVRDQHDSTTDWDAENSRTGRHK